MSNTFPFKTPLDTRAVEGGYELLAPLKYYSTVLNKTIEVPTGFFTDFASIPRVARVFITGHGQDRWAAVVHDYLYSVGYDRRTADVIFLEAMAVSGVGFFKRRLMYRAVRTGGWMFHESN
jgi:hypothetical protein|tara:strand:+ start:113 stop:475 length:363 start_codon:yes stop_codon:yes gene_type:complete